MERGLAVVRERKPAALAERLGRIYGIRVEVAARLGEYTFSGKIRQDRGVEYILNLLSETSDVICKVENGVMRAQLTGPLRLTET